MAPCPIHTLRFFALEPSAIHAMAWSAQIKCLAVSRADNSIELWDFAQPSAPCLWKWLAGNAEASIEALSWAGPDQDRLFSTGLHGLVLEYDLVRLATKHQSAVTSGPAWCMGVHGDRLAVGTEEGYVCLFRISSDGLDYDKVLDKQEGRILCLAWHSSGRYIVTGSPDTIRVWNVETGHPTQRMTTGRLEKHKETIVWSVGVSDDLTIISGDSRGKTSFWNGQKGTLLDTYQTHKADVLVVAFNPDQNVAYSSGVDPLIVHFQPIVRPHGDRLKWVKSIHRSVHTHDVRAMVCLNNMYFSGGVDTHLTLSDVATKTVSRYPPLPRSECAHLAETARAILLQYQRHLELWQLCELQQVLPDPQATPLRPGSTYVPPEEPEKLLYLETKDDEIIRHAHISDQANLVAYVTSTRLCVFRLTFQPRPKIHKFALEDANSRFELPHIFRFYRDHKTQDQFLVTGTDLGNLQVFAIQDQAFTLKKTYLGHDLGLSTSIAQLKVDQKGRRIVVSDHDGHLVCINAQDGKLITRMAKYQNARIVALAFRKRTSELLVTYSDHKLATFDLVTGKHSKLGLKTCLPKEWNRKKKCTRGVLEGANERVILYDDLTLCSIDTRPKTMTPAQTPTKKERKEKNGLYNPGQVASIPKLLSKYEHLVYLGAIDEALVAVEVKAQSIEAQLPPSLRQKKFGVM
ncbi:hypothetical protein TCAL_04923 [Tigriopus californicus]|uniref:Anaphase-promoting complex subunit 4-like WD40 domain-containing protein n=1 Tax=Tigriopus californicus TaxID=6832 RepID=A0A553NBZ4_TIGCA|nr:U3 small nucleolar RNA-associated protein 4 homolog [Tigriopus californicus]TRY62961.1 hypothetical protein TCAL_04923 [Tigriopus californicus]